MCAHEFYITPLTQYGHQYLFFFFSSRHKVCSVHIPRHFRGNPSSACVMGDCGNQPPHLEPPPCFCCTAGSRCDAQNGWRTLGGRKTKTKVPTVSAERTLRAVEKRVRINCVKCYKTTFCYLKKKIKKNNAWNFSAFKVYWVVKSQTVLQFPKSPAFDSPGFDSRIVLALFRHPLLLT